MVACLATRITRCYAHYYRGINATGLKSLNMQFGFSTINLHNVSFTLLRVYIYIYILHIVIYMYLLYKKSGIFL